jgi:recombination protein RecT
MNTAVAEPKTTAHQQQPPIATFRQQLEQRLATFAEALPPHISPERFKSVVAWAVTADPALLAADRVSLFEACLAAANDGLLPDKKQGALVVYNTKIKEDGKEFWIKKVQWMPMVRGIFDKIYNTGKVKSAKVAIVYGGDRFRTWTDDLGDHIEYEEGDEQDRDTIRSAFALVVMTDGGVFVEAMKPADIEKIRAKSKNSDRGPWVDWWEEMAKKSVFRRLAKRLPMARDLDNVMSRDDAFEQLADTGQQQRRAMTPPRPPSAMLGAPVAQPVAMNVMEHEPVEQERQESPEDGPQTRDDDRPAKSSGKTRKRASPPAGGQARQDSSQSDSRKDIVAGETVDPDTGEVTGDQDAVRQVREAIAGELLTIAALGEATGGRLERLEVRRADLIEIYPEHKSFIDEAARIAAKVIRGEQKADVARKYLEVL